MTPKPQPPYTGKVKSGIAPYKPAPFVTNNSGYNPRKATSGLTGRAKSIAMMNYRRQRNP